MTVNRKRNSDGNRIRIGGQRLRDDDCLCCNCDEFSGCLYCPDISDHTTNDTVTFPDGVTHATVICIGQGGNGGSSTAAGEAGGGGGGGESAITNWLVNSDGALDLIINSSSNGYASEVKQGGVTKCKGLAGATGGVGPAGPGGAGGDGGVGDKLLPGGKGADGVDTDGDEIGSGGGGGGSAGTANAGGDALGWQGGSGGTLLGGDGGDAPSGDAGGVGGGGAGGFSRSNGGSGGAGRVRIIWHIPAQIQITISGAPTESGLVCECDPLNDYYNEDNLDLLWGNLNGTYTLDQSMYGGSDFQKLWTSLDRDELSGGGILVYKRAVYQCAGYEGIDGINTEVEWYISGLFVQLGCSGGRMYIANFAFSLTLCSRSQYWTGTEWTDWDAWTCSELITTEHPLCTMGDVTQYAAGCSTQTMATELIWAALIPEELRPCVVLYDCEGIIEAPTVGSITGSVNCAS